MAIMLLLMSVFTFQYVSINTVFAMFFLILLDIFTFQYVSINTQTQGAPRQAVQIYIPICFY